MIGGNQLNENQIARLEGSLAGTTAGNVTYRQINLGGVKIVILFFNGYENDTTTNQSITFPIAYVNAPRERYAGLWSGMMTLPEPDRRGMNGHQMQ